MSVTNEKLLLLQDSDKLRKELNIVIRWRILTTKGGIARIVAYQDARDVQKVLDHVCGQSNWSNEPVNLGGKMYMTIGINTDEGWVYKNDVGTETDIESAKGEASDAFKRSAVMWGIFRDIYEIDYIVLKASGNVPLTEDGTRLESAEAITTYCNGISAPMNHLRRLYMSMKNRLVENEEALNAMATIKQFINEI